MENQKEWRGTATELLSCLPQIDMQPNKLTKKLNICIEKLYADYQITYKSSKEHDGRMIYLEKFEKKNVEKV